MSNNNQNHISDREIQNILDGIIPLSRSAAGAHLHTCTQCKKQFEEYRKLYSLLNTDIPSTLLPSAVPDIAQLWESIPSGKELVQKEHNAPVYEESTEGFECGAITAQTPSSPHTAIPIFKTADSTEDAERKSSRFTNRIQLLQKTLALSVFSLLGIGIILIPDIFGTLFSLFSRFISLVTPFFQEVKNSIVTYIQAASSILSALSTIKDSVQQVSFPLLSYIIIGTAALFVITLVDRMIFQHLISRR